MENFKHPPQKNGRFKVALFFEEKSGFFMILKIFCVSAYSVEAVFKKVLENVLAEKKCRHFEKHHIFSERKPVFPLKNHGF